MQGQGQLVQLLHPYICDVPLLRRSRARSEDLPLDQHGMHSLGEEWTPGEHEQPVRRSQMRRLHGLCQSLQKGLLNSSLKPKPARVWVKN